MQTLIRMYHILLARRPASGRPSTLSRHVPPGRRPTSRPTAGELLETGLEFIDTSFENASPLWYEVAPDGTVLVHLVYDHERSSPNRAAGHFHFRLHARPGSTLTLEFRNLDNVWNGRKASVADELKVAVVSDGREGVEAGPAGTAPRGPRAADRHDARPRAVRGPRRALSPLRPREVARVDQAHPLVEITPIGKTVEGRALEIIRVGRPDAPYRVFLRARAHPWEPGGNWVVQGLVDRLLKGDDEAKRYLERYCVYVLPMANKDGVARGRTRFNLRGKDLNRNWDRPADPALAPENHALETWLEAMIAAGKRPHLALELHNDGNGQLHISRPPVADLDRHLDRMKTLEALLREHTWFTEGSTNAAFRNAGTLGDGWLERYGIDAAVHEFNVNWIAGLKDYPSGRALDALRRATGPRLPRVLRRRQALTTNLPRRRTLPRVRSTWWSGKDAEGHRSIAGPASRMT